MFYASIISMAVGILSSQINTYGTYYHNFTTKTIKITNYGKYYTGNQVWFDVKTIQENEIKEELDFKKWYPIFYDPDIYGFSIDRQSRSFYFLGCVSTIPQVASLLILEKYSDGSGSSNLYLVNTHDGLITSIIDLSVWFYYDSIIHGHKYSVKRRNDFTIYSNISEIDDVDIDPPEDEKLSFRDRLLNFFGRDLFHRTHQKYELFVRLRIDEKGYVRESFNATLY